MRKNEIVFNLNSKKGKIVIKNLNAFEYREYVDTILIFHATVQSRRLPDKTDNILWCKG